MRGRIGVTSGLLVAAHLIVHVGFGVGRGAPDFLTLALLLMAREIHAAGSALVGLVLGLVEDAQGLMAFGAGGFAMAVVGALATFAVRTFTGESTAFAILYLFAGKWLRDFLYWIAVGAANRPDALGSLVVDAGLGAAYMTAVGLLLLFLLGDLRRPLGAR